MHFVHSTRKSPAHPYPPPFAHMHKKQELAVNNVCKFKSILGILFFFLHCKTSYSKYELCLLSSWTFRAFMIHEKSHKMSFYYFF